MNIQAQSLSGLRLFLYCRNVAEEVMQVLYTKTGCIVAEIVMSVSDL
jgi:hypothetical protein